MSGAEPSVLHGVVLIKQMDNLTFTFY